MFMLMNMVFEKYGLINVLLITPQTSVERINFIDSVSNGFIYMVSSSVTISIRIWYARNLFQTHCRPQNPQVIGFGINNKETFNQATQFAKGAIIGSAIQDLTKTELENCGLKDSIKN
jgi:tryptophan synthase alpha chain